MQHTPVFLPEESPWPVEPGGLQSMGLQRVRHHLVTKHWAKSLSSGKKKKKKEFISYLWTKGGKTLFASSQFSLAQNNFYVKETFFKMTYSDFLQWI